MLIRYKKHLSPLRVKESTLLLTVFFHTEKVFKRNVQVQQDIRPRFYSFAT